MASSLIEINRLLISVRAPSAVWIMLIDPSEFWIARFRPAI